MFQLDALTLTVIVVALGVGFWLLALYLMRVASRSRPMAAAEVTANPSLQPNETAVLVIEPGGKLLSINERGREVFRLSRGEQADLERLVKRIRPSEKFLELCAAEGRARFVLDGKPFVGLSFQVRDEGRSVMVASLQLDQATGLGSVEGGISSTVLQSFTELIQSMAASLDLKDTLVAIMNGLDKLIPADIIEISLWESESEVLVPYRMLGVSGFERRLEQPPVRYRSENGYSGYVFQRREPLLITDVDSRHDIHPALDRSAVPMRSYVGVPLIVGKEAIGTLELGSLNPETYQQSDVELLHLISGQAAIAIHNALLYREEQKRTAELSGLAQLAQAFSSARDPKGLYSSLVQSIVPLVQVEILGFLLYNESQRTLEGQVPFHGLPAQFIDLYSAPVPAGSPVEQTLLAQDIILSENAAEDAHWDAIGLGHLAQAASLRDTILVPLASGGHMLGYLQASNHLDGSTFFTQDELHLLMIIANQAASIIENAMLVQQSRQRAQRAEALRRVSSLASSAATLDEILMFSLQELAHLLQADLAAVFLMDKTRGALDYQPAATYGNVPALPDIYRHLTMDDPQFHFTVTGRQHVLTFGQADEEKALIPYYQQILAVWKLQSVIAVPLIVRDEGIGEIWLGSQLVNFFDRGDLQVVTTAAGQLAGVVEQSYLSAQTDDSLRRKVEQLTALTRISRELSTSLDMEYLLQLVYDEARRTTRADCGTILLFDINEPEGDGKEPAVRFAIGDEHVRALSEQELAILKGVEPYHVADINQAGVRPPHEGVQSMLILPVIYQQRPAGLLMLHAFAPHRFDHAAVEIAQSLASQTAVALSNAVQYEDQSRRAMLLRREVDTLGKLFQVSQVIRPNQPLEQALSSIARAITDATPFQMVLISVYDAETDSLRRITSTGLTGRLWEDVRERTQPWRGVAQFFLPEFQVGSSYYIPTDHKPIIPADVHFVNVLPMLDQDETSRWQDGDLLLMPLYDAEGVPLGMVSLDMPGDGRRPDRPTFQALELFAMQASLVIESRRHVESLQSQILQLGADQSRLYLAAQNARRHLPVLLHKELEQAITTQNLHRQLQRIQAGLEITDAVSVKEGQTVEPLVMLKTLGREILTRFDFQAALIAEHNASGTRLLDMVGASSDGDDRMVSTAQALFGQRNPLRQVVQDGSLLLIANLDTDTTWANNPLLNALSAKSLLGLPVDVGDGMRFGILAVAQRPLPPFTAQDRQIYHQMARQISVALQNLQLLTETRRRLQEMDLLLDYTRKLTTLDVNSILNSLVETALKAIPEANAGWVALWEEKHRQLVPRAAGGFVNQASMLAIRFPLEITHKNAGALPLPLRAYQGGQAMIVREVEFAQDYNLSSENLLHYRQATAGHLPVSSLLLPLRLTESVLGVLVLDNYTQAGAFSDDDEALAFNLTQQTALALENARLYQTAGQRAVQLQALTEVAGAITSSLKTEELVGTLLERLAPVLPYDTATLWLRRGNMLTVADASGFTDSESRIGLSVAVEDSVLFKEMIATGRALLVPDVRQDGRFPSLLTPDYLSWLGIPLLAKAELIGMIAVEKSEADFYSEEHVQAATTFASQAAVALDNARLFEESTRRASELDQRSQRLALLNRLSSELGSSLDVDYILKLTAQQLLTALDPHLGVRVAAVLVNEQGRFVLQTEVPPWRPTLGVWEDRLPQVLADIPLLQRLRESLGIFSTSDILQETELEPFRELYLMPREVRALLVLPLATGTSLHGWFLIETTEVYRFTSPEVELARTISNQAAIAIENARLFAETRRLARDLEQRVEDRTADVVREHRNTQTLLRIITELSASLDINQVLNRALSVLNDSIGAEQSLIILAQGNNRFFQAGMPLVVIPPGPAKDRPPLQPEEDMARWVVKHKAATLVDDVQGDDRWPLASDRLPAYRSVIGVPLILGEEVLGTLLLFHRHLAFFGLEQIGLIEAAARQISIALNNAELFNLIRDQAEHLGGMLRDQQIEATRSRAILEAVADGVLVTNAGGQVALFNASAQRILELKHDQVVGKSLDQFVGLFGKAARTWMHTIRKWSQDTRSYREGETYAEQIELENGQVVSVHLAPVIWRTDFLGTVSIFRDITHEVQVDRLKSEFVANVSHELRTPMTSIKGYVEIMLMGAAGPLSPQQTHFLQVVKSNTERLSVLVNDLLDVSRIEAGRVTLSMQPINLSELAEDVASDLRRRAQEENKEMTFELEIPANLPLVQGDVERVRQVLGNLVSNGYNYTPAGGRVLVSMHQEDDEVQVDVIDNGIGIAMPDHNRIFERFYRGEDPLVLATAGTGLGLAISKTLIDMHRGRIWFNSSGVSGEGSVFSFTLPIHQPEE